MLNQYTSSTLDIIANAIPGHVVLIKPDDAIGCVNQSWTDFAQSNGLSVDFDWRAYNYFTVNV